MFLHFKHNQHLLFVISCSRLHWIITWQQCFRVADHQTLVMSDKFCLHYANVWTWHSPQRSSTSAGPTFGKASGGQFCVAPSLLWNPFLWNLSTTFLCVLYFRDYHDQVTKREWKGCKWSGWLVLYKPYISISICTVRLDGIKSRS